MVSVRSRVHRTLRHLQQFQFGGLAEPDDLIGTYYQVDPSDFVEIRQHGLVVSSHGSLVTINYANIQSVEIDLERLGLSLTVAGHSFFLPVTGTQGRFKDVFEFSRFLLNVTGV